MNIDRKVSQTTAIERVKFCLDRLEEDNQFSKGIEWGTGICYGLSVEEMIGALVSAEQELTEEVSKIGEKGGSK